MIYIKNDSRDPYYNLALEEYFFKTGAAGDYVLMFWQNSPSVIIGRYQNTIEEINDEFIKNNNVKVARRITGGGAVYHDEGNLNYSFILPSKDSLIDFETFTKPIIAALKSMGIKASLSGRNDLEIDGKKFSGNAQAVHKGRTLHHGTLLFDVDLEALEKSLKIKKGKIESQSIKSVKSRVTNLRPYLSEDLNIDQFKSQLIAFFQKWYGLEEYVLSTEDKRSIENLAEGRYNTWKWTYKESPKCNVVRGKRFKNGYLEFHLQIEEGHIKEAYLYGDFFSSRNVHEIISKLVNTKYDRISIVKELSNIDFEDYFGGSMTEVSLDDIVKVII